MTDQDDKALCPKCSEKIAAGLARCPECDAQLAPEVPAGMKLCPYCREAIKDQAVRCKHCKKDLDTQPPGEPAPESPTGSSQPAKERPGKPRHRFVVAAAAVLVAGGGYAAHRVWSLPPDTRPGCTAGNIDACLERGRALVQQSHRDRAFPYLGFATLWGLEPARQLLDEVKRGYIPNRDRLSAVLGRACERGDGPSCFSSAILAEKSGGVEATNYFGSLCDGGDFSACIRLGSVFFHGGWGVTKDLEKVGVLFRRACDGGEMKGCRRLAARGFSPEGQQTRWGAPAARRMT